MLLTEESWVRSIPHITDPSPTRWPGESSGLCEISLWDTRSSLPSSFSFSQRDNLVGPQFHGVRYFNSLIDKGGYTNIFTHKGLEEELSL